MKTQKALWVWIPKVAGSSIWNKLHDAKTTATTPGENQRHFISETADIFTFMHMPLPEIVEHKMMPLDELEERLIFAFVRNPYDRLVSLYERNKHLGAWSFPAFLDVLIADPFTATPMPEYPGCAHGWPQSRFLYGATHDIAPDWLGMLEGIDRDWPIIACRIGASPSRLSHYNLNQNRKPWWGEYYTDALADKAYEFYREDFERFGYKRKIL